MHDLARLLDAAIGPKIVPTPGFPADVHIEDRFHPRLSLASHDLSARPELQAEVARFAVALPVVFPAELVGDMITIHRFEHATWQGHWWEHLRWTHVRSWRMIDAPQLPGDSRASGD